MTDRFTTIASPPTIRLSNGVELPAQVIKQTIEVNGARAWPWLAALPTLIDRIASDWNLTALSPFGNLSFNVVLQAVRAGRPVVLKVGLPTAELRSEIAALQLVHGDGAAALLEAKPDDGAMLLERIMPGTPLRQSPDDLTAARIAAAAMRRYWRPVPASHPFRDIADWIHGLDRLRPHFDDGTGPFPPALVNQAERLFARLLATRRHIVVLHGDFHHDNILRDGESGWTVIDPKGITGEPEYEIAAFLRNVNRMGAVDPISMLQERIDLFARELDLDPERIRDWTVAESVLSAWWVVEDGGERSDAIANAIETAELRG